MHDDGIGFAILRVNRLVKSKQAPISVRLLLRRKSFLLGAGHVQDIDPSDAIGHIGIFEYLVTGIFK